VDNLYQICQANGFNPRLCCEVGAAHPNTVQLRDFIKNGVQCLLFEANPRLFYCLKEGFDDGDFQTTWPNIGPAPHQHPGFGHLSNVALFNVAIHDARGEINIFERNASSFVEGAISPAKANDQYVEDLKDAVKVPCDTIATFDHGNIDLLAADVGGGEWYVIKHLKSRPKLICLETHGQRYVNPFIKEIEAWMTANQYRLLGRTESDSLWVRSES